ncbi:TIGR01777 family oxidoreductase [Corynebacterium pacaense]|uniref:TIGR01777 family oxidoreductase n=1 Tax=Corynebacterium pacaense TaxID=1816684 RepID=UPI0009BA5F83|nr:TIGR01777 family oxidoreductase [Corynebacterium pacaense]
MADRTIVISGASGLIGTALVKSFAADGVAVKTLVRHTPETRGEVYWNPAEGQLDAEELVGAQAVINLNGASISRLPWIPSYRKTLLSSRLQPTNTLVNALKKLGADAPRLVSASAVGFYGSLPGETISESTVAGDTFLADVCIAWERAAQGAPGPVSLLRTAPLLHRRALLKPLIPLTRFGLAGPLGSGQQYWPWISLTDEVRAIRHIIDEGIDGPVNLVGPEAVTANETGRYLAHRLHRPFLLPVPAWALRAVLSRQAADSLLLADAHVLPTALTDSGFTFIHRTAAEAIDAALSGR